MSPLARVVLAPVLLAVALVPLPASAQVPAADLRLMAQPIWHGAEDPLGLRLRIFNDSSVPLEGFTLSVAAYDSLDSRSGLHESFDGTSGLASTFPLDLRDRTVEPGAATEVRLNEPVSSLVTIAQSLEGAVHPLTVTLYAADGVTVLDSVTTQILYFPKLDDVRPLQVVPVWAINEIPGLSPTGGFVADPLEDRHLLEDAVATDGWLTGIITAIETRAGRKLHLGIAPTPRVVEELDDMASGYPRVTGDEVERVARTDERARRAAAVLDRLRAILELRGLQTVLVPYSFPDLPVLGELEALNTQVVEGETVLREVLGAAASRRWLFPPAGRLDVATLENLRAVGAAAGTFFSTESLVAAPDPSLAGCPEAFASFVCPVRVETLRGDTTGYVHDAELQERFAELIRGDEQRVLLQNLFAELAMIWAELPGVEGRTVHVTIPSFWRPSPLQSELFFRGLAKAPWIQTLTPNEGVHRGVPPASREVVDLLPRTQNEPAAAFVDTLEAAEQTIESFARIRPPRTLLQRLRRASLVAHSRVWWADPVLLARGQDFAEDAGAAARAEMDKITVGSFGQITLTSRRGSIPLVVFNDTGYPVTLTIRLSSPNLDLDPPVLTKTFGAGSPQESIEATARASGIFPLQVSLETPAEGDAGGYVIQSRSIRIRSTEFNEVALAITAGALAFLILFYAVRAVRRTAA